jgi:hypothetical protein
MKGHHRPPAGGFSMCLIFNERLGWALPNRIDGSPLQGEDAGTAFGWCLIGALKFLVSVLSWASPNCIDGSPPRLRRAGFRASIADTAVSLLV